MRAYLSRIAIVALAACALAQGQGKEPPAAKDDLAEAFVSPADGTKPRCYWYWMRNSMSREGITKDLEAMKRVGIGEAYIGFIDGGKATRALSEEWWQMLEHAVREGTRIGVDIGLFNSLGWSQSGGPWVKPDQAMRHVVLPEMRLHGPQKYSGKLPTAPGAFQDLAVLAFPAPAQEADTATAQGATITKTPTAVTFVMPKPFTARSLTVHPTQKIDVTAELQASDDGVKFRTLRTFSIERSKLGLNIGPVPLAPICIAFPATTATTFRVTFKAACDPGELVLSGAPRVESLAEKSLMKMCQRSQPPFDFYRWAPQAEPEVPGLAVDPAAVRDISRQMASDGTLTWDVPAGDWIILRTGLVPTGVKNSPAPLEATGLEVDKMSRKALKAHFDAYVGKLLSRIPAAERTAWKHVVADSYETGSQNWTDGLQADFQKRYGYDPLPFLPVMTGRIVGSASQSDRFLWDLRRLVADRISQDYVGGLRDLCRANGLKMWLENYGHWGFPAEFLQYGGNTDEISGEFWATGSLGMVELRAASSAAHIYGKNSVFAEAFTGGPAFISTPWSLKQRGDWAMCQGINQFVLHTYIHQPWEDRLPGNNAWYGTEFNRHNTWFESSKSWIDYLRRCSVLLQQGQQVADVAYFIGEDAPRAFGARHPEIPQGYDFDYINAEVLMTRATAKDGRLVLPDGMSYKLLVLPPQDTLRPELLQKIASLVKAGVVVYGPRPVRSPSMQGYPDCDTKVKTLAGELWDKHLVIQDGDLKKVLLEQCKTPPDLDGVDAKNILYTHRRSADADIYFLSNQTDSVQDIVPAFRVTGRAPELWHPETGSIERLAVYDMNGETARVPVRLEARGSVFVVFRGAAAADRIIAVTRDGAPLNSAQAGVASTSNPNTFSMAMWVKPSGDTTLMSESNQGASFQPRNDAIFPPHGDTFAPGGNHAGVGLAVGRNGVCVLEHGTGYLAPVLVHAATIDDWTHVAVVYRDGQPSLYLNGVFARQGLKSSRTVHPGTPASTGPVPFKGELGGFDLSARALEAGDIAAWMKAMPRELQTNHSSAAEFVRDGGGRLALRAGQPGRYEFTTANGKAQVITVQDIPKPLAMTGTWQVQFPGIAAPLPFPQLMSWTEHADANVKYFSGTATYRTTFDAPAGRTGERRILDLGRVESLAEVTLNDRKLGTLWKQPYRLDVTDAIKAGSNVLEVKVVNTWNNRLMGQKLEPAAFSAPGTFIPWVASWPNYKPSTPLQPSGLLGPVQVTTLVERGVAADR